jgi:hypothetical protein
MFGILMAVCSVLFITQIFTDMIILKGNKVTNQFLNDMLFKMQNSPVFFFTIVVFVVIGYYILFSATQGNVKLGVRFFFISFYPIKEKETFINSFFANCMLMNLYSVAATQFMVQCFAPYMVGTVAAKIWLVQIANIEFFGWLF